MLVTMEHRIRHYLTKNKALPYPMRRVPNKAMLTGKELGDALRIAIEKKSALLQGRGEGRLTKKAVADHFHVQPPSVQDWINFGRIGKHHLNELVTFFSDVVDASHWGIEMGTPSENRGLTAVRSESESVVYPDFAETNAALQIDAKQLNQFVADLRKAFKDGRLTPHRFALLRGLLTEGMESPPSSIENQKIATRGGDGRYQQHRRKSGTQ